MYIGLLLSPLQALTERYPEGLVREFDVYALTRVFDDIRRTLKISR